MQKHTSSTPRPGAVGGPASDLRAAQDEARSRWNGIYRQGRETRLHPTLARFFALAPVGRALEIAGGTGANALFLARQGFTVDAFDISEVAVRKAQQQARQQGLPVRCFVGDAAAFPFPPETYDLIVNFYFLERRAFPGIARALKPGGVLIFETFNWRHLKVRPATRPEHLLQPWELPRAFPQLLPLYYREHENRTTFIARKPGARHGRYLFLPPHLLLGAGLPPAAGRCRQPA